ncbi:unnamed protein product [Haemonchus placei]|uniref:Uncharacterized protein n=1 Tax=Haemonchus placei TaxID=6290 RepID=A0A0N4WJ45_HAEPC|nr:unnamed protein product [Haemonchus placei]
MERSRTSSDTMTLEFSVHPSTSKCNVAVGVAVGVTSEIVMSCCRQKVRYRRWCSRHIALLWPEYLGPRRWLLSSSMKAGPSVTASPRVFEECAAFLRAGINV